jgi:hypothetical protein
MSAAEDDFATLSDDARHILEQLGGLSPAEYGRRRAAWAEELEIPVVLLDAEYKARRKNEASNEAREIFSSVEPWPEPVSGASLLQAIVRRLKRHVIFSDDAAARLHCGLHFAGRMTLQSIARCYWSTAQKRIPEKLPFWGYSVSWCRDHCSSSRSVQRSSTA